MLKLKNYIELNPKEHISKGEIVRQVTMADLEPFSRDIKKCGYVKYKSGTKFRNGDTLLARITPCLENGKTSFVNFLKQNEVAVGSTEFYVLRAIEGKMDPNYLYYLSISKKFRKSLIKSMTGTSGRQRATKEAVLDYDSNIPNIDNQKTISHKLSLIDDMISVNNQINDNLLDLVDTLFDNIIKCSILYKATLNDIGTIAGGGTPSKKVNVYWNGKIPWLTPKDLSKSHSIFTSKGTRFITEYGLKESSARLFPAGTVLFSSRAPIGYISIAKNNITTSQGFKSIIPNKGYSPEFIYELLKKETPLIVREANGSTFKEISGTRLKTHIVNIPSKEKAKYFDNSALSIFKLISKNENENKILKNLKKELLNKIF